MRSGKQRTHTGNFSACSAHLSSVFQGITAAIIYSPFSLPHSHTVLSTKVQCLKKLYFFQAVDTQKHICIIYRYLYSKTASHRDFYAYTA